MKDVFVLCTETKISAISDIAPLWDAFAKSGISQCVIVCEDIEPSILGMFLVNKATGRFQTVVIKAVGDALKDIEACIGATRVSASTGVSFQNINIKHLGKAKKVIVDNGKTLFIAEDTSKASVYADYLKKCADEERNMYIKERLLKRVSQLKGGVAVLKIGGSDYNREYLKDKADDAIKASKVALQEGIVEGGGLCLYRIAESIKPKTIGEEIVKNSLKSPFKKIVENAGKDYAEIVLNMPKDMGYDAKDNKYVNMFNEGIIDPAKVERCSIENAISNAANLITAYAAIAEDDSPNSK